MAAQTTARTAPTDERAAVEPFAQRLLDLVRKTDPEATVRFAEPLGVPVDGLPLDEAATAVIDALTGVIARLERFGVPNTLSAAGATRPELGDVADRVLRDAGAAANPRPIDRDDLLGMFEAAW